ncbi:MAG: MotA/TolQ/ExbB proton channel family protein [Dethiobacteria bacterium]|jgi:biopolymer transport protein ExbB/TolQ|nr:MotA/TolQ/ExbB proton channel family protein [Bacillota bacterium]HPZ41888.1 MotA/TolQ/ExbB proton channel family protein [Bacillota bacterium]HQD52743.1 MotA/TolQ/ExbB proton channel family protein [Bacillota bacterium]
MFTKEYLNQVMYTIAQSLEVPDIVVLLILIAVSIVLVGTLLAEYFTEHIRLKVKLPQLFDELNSGEIPTAECIRNSGLLKRQKQALIELTRHPELTAIMREALAVRLITEEQAHYDQIVKVSDLVAKLGPIFGLLGTLIPLGPGIIAMGQGDTYTLSQSLLTAFDTTILGLISAAVAMVVSMIRRGWYDNYMSALEAVMESVLEVEKKNAGQASEPIKIEAETV